jgi:hypothetical protein
MHSNWSSFCGKLKLPVKFKLRAEKFETWKEKIYCESQSISLLVKKWELSLELYICARKPVNMPSDLPLLNIYSIIWYTLYILGKEVEDSHSFSNLSSLNVRSIFYTCICTLSKVKWSNFLQGSMLEGCLFSYQDFKILSLAHSRRQNINMLGNISFWLGFLEPANKNDLMFVV